ncbi:MAG TPA: hypothetical protein VFV58_19615 [Blastocatellia bacterium]|nr:hypothetical protein [Blastocatellia bacterium]
MIDSLGATNRKEIHITPWGTPHPHCPGCHQLPKSVPQSHACPELNGLLTTARARCSFCEGQERTVVAVDREESRNETEASRIGSADEFGAPDPSYLVLEEVERKASAIRALEADAEAREAKAQERLRQVEARLREEMSRRSEVERKSLEIEEELKRQPEIDQIRIEAVRAASEATARFEEEQDARIAAEQAKAEAEAKLFKMEARASEAEERLRRAEVGLQQEGSKRASTEERLRQAEVGLQQEASKRASSEERLRQVEVGLQQEASNRTSAEERASELEARLASETAKIKSEAEAKIHSIGAETRRIEENYKVEIDWIRGELEEAVAAARRAEENHRSEMTRITFEAESRAQQAEAIARQYQIKVEEAIASAQAAMFNLEETQKKLDDAEARYREMEIRARQAETRSQRLYLISKLGFTTAEQVITETLDAGDEDEKDTMVIPLSLETNSYLDNFPAETPESDANSSMDYGDSQFSDRMRALFRAAARANGTEDKSGRMGSEEG